MAFLILRVGGTFDVLREQRGDYDDWFRDALGLSERECPDVAPMEGEPLPDEATPFEGIVVTGSAALVTDREPWSEATGHWLARQVQRDVPVLGVCYGHQLLAHALGGQVERNPQGRQIGSVEVELHPNAGDDALLAGMPTPHMQQASHTQSVVAPPPSAVVLGHTARDPHHVLRFARQAWGVQFHPEFDAHIVRTYIDQRREVIREEGQDPEALEQGARDAEHGRELLRRFVALCRAT